MADKLFGSICKGVFLLKSIVDSHTHSSFSIDSQMPAKDGVLSAIKVGLGGIIFTDHLDLDYPGSKIDFSFDFAERSSYLDELRKEFDGKIKIFKGMEVGFQPQAAAKSSEIISSYDFDFIINSIHVVDNVDICHKDFHESGTKQQVFRRYLDAIYASVDKFDDFDVVGHIGYLCRYVPYSDKSLKYAEYSDFLDAIFKRVIAKGKGIEVNTAGYFYKLGFPHPDFDSLKRYKELGGEIITIGSDAHATGNIGQYFRPVLEELLKVGFKYITYFEKRKPAFVKLS
jgi:histidinol-phosphatase (PHP family)